MAQDITSREVPIGDVQETGCGLVHRYWDGRRGACFAPAWGDFRLIDLAGHVIPYMRVADVIDGGRDFKYRFWGTGLGAVHALDRTGAHLSEVNSPRTKTALAEFRRIVSEKVCLAFVYNAQGGIDRRSLHAPSIRLPLSSDGETVDKIVCYTDFDIDAREWRRFFEESAEAAQGR
ncbi:MAG TPA: hypothetical protein DC046_00920 [Rhodospirillaceae bacterium]|nr:hypothetical protein [Rhodospirillaceae bacterium]|tara:strand:- start:989 stop:1516 length:528 start_codon:yes stop_codon:yes gene_type:complete